MTLTEFERLVETLKPALLTMARQRIHDAADAEDIVQETLADLARRMSRIRVETSERYAWRALTNHIRAYQRPGVVSPDSVGRGPGRRTVAWTTKSKIPVVSLGDPINPSTARNSRHPPTWESTTPNFEQSVETRHQARQVLLTLTPLEVQRLAVLLARRDWQGDKLDCRLVALRQKIKENLA